MTDIDAVLFGFFIAVCIVILVGVVSVARHNGNIWP